MQRFNAKGPDGLIDGKAPGKRPKLLESQRQELARIVESGPVPAVHGVIRWRLVDLAQWIFEEFGITISKQTLSRTLRAKGYRKLSARPRHYAQKAGEAETFKNIWPAPSARGFCNPTVSVGFNVSGLGAELPAKMEIRAMRSS